MKNIISKSVIAILLLLGFIACSPEKFESPVQSGVPQASDLNITISVNDTNNVVTFHCDNTKCVPIWIFSDGKLYAQNDYQATYKKAGTYSVEVKAFNNDGISDGSVVKTFVITKNYMSPQEKAYVKALTGSGTKTWVWDSGTDGHFGCGEPGGAGLNWWSCGANGKKGTGLYDDQITFTSDGGYTYSPGADGLLYVNAGSGYKPEYLVTAGVDYDVPSTSVTATYSLAQAGNNYYITLPAGTMMSYIPNAATLTNPNYKILSLTDNLLELVADNGSIVWHYRFIPKN